MRNRFVLIFQFLLVLIFIEWVGVKNVMATCDYIGWVQVQDCNASCVEDGLGGPLPFWKSICINFDGTFWEEHHYRCDVCDAQPTGGWTCFPAGTKVQMASENQNNINNQETITKIQTITNNQEKNNQKNPNNQQKLNNKLDNNNQMNIEDVRVGDRVVSQDERGNKSVSTVTKLDQPIRDHLCQINFTDGSDIKLTSEHPLFSDTGWKAIDPKKTFEEIPSLPVTELKKGDKIVKSDDGRVEVKSFACWSEKIQTYNLILDGGVHTYFAGGLLAHNKNPPHCPVGKEQICPNFPQNNYCAVVCIFPDKWTGDFTSCGTTPSGFPKYWCSGCYRGVVPTPTSAPPNSSPVGTLSCPAQISLGSTGSFTLHGGDADGNLSLARLYYSLNPPFLPAIALRRQAVILEQG